MRLNEQPDSVIWPQTHYVFLEKTGPFQEIAPQCWQTLHALLPTFTQSNQVTGYTSLYKAGPKLYRPGVSLAAAPKNLPDALGYEHFAGGKYARFVLTGPYSDLGAATGRVFELIAERKISVRDDFFIEHYVNDPRTTPEQDLITEMLVPTA